MRRFNLIFLLFLLATACTPATESAAPESVEEAAPVVSPTETIPPPVVTVDTPRVEPPTAVPEPTQPPAEPIEAAAEAEPAVEEVVAEGGVTSGRTEEGAFFLGAPNAPITHIDYSDFL